MAERKHKKQKKTLGWMRAARYAVPGAVLALVCGLIFLLAATRLLPAKYLIVLCAGLFAFVAMTAALLWSKRREVFAVGVVSGAIAVVLLSGGIVLASRGLSALDVVTSPNSETVYIGVYVRAEDPAETLEDVADYLFGIMAISDRESVDQSIGEIETVLGSSLRVVELSGPVQLADALLGGSVDAVIMNAAYPDMLDDTEGYEYIYQKIREISGVSIEVEPGEERSPWEPVEIGEKLADIRPFVIYVSGIDSRTGLYARSRSDANILAVINPAARQILLVSTPRDYYVPLSISGENDKLTHAGIYGVQVSMDTLEMLYDIHIDYYFRIHFEGFEGIVDSLGGITVYSDYEFTSQHGSDYHYVKGENQMDGEKALFFARERFSFSDGDRQRGRNHMAVIRAIIQKALSAKVLTNFTSLMDAVEGSFETSIPYELIAALIRGQLEEGGGWDIVTYSVSGMDSHKVTWSQGVEAYVMIPYQEDVDTAKELLKQAISGMTVEAP